MITNNGCFADVFVGDCLESLKQMCDRSVNMCVTSPPYYGLRDYGVEGQIGLEETPEQYIDRLVAVFREVRRVLTDDGTLWVNIGDSYAGNASTGGHGKETSYTGKRALPTKRAEGIKTKDLIGIPWMLAFALRADGWYLRQDIIWHKPNPMPESVRDRCTKAHEYVFLLSKSPSYFYDHEAVKEPSIHAGKIVTLGEKSLSKGQANGAKVIKSGNALVESVVVKETRNKRSVWTVTPKAYKGAHFAVFPPDLIEPCIRAGTSERGNCPTCGSPWQRVVDAQSYRRDELPHDHPHYRPGFYTDGKAGDEQSPGPGQRITHAVTQGWQPTCDCYSVEPLPDYIKDDTIGINEAIAMLRADLLAHYATLPTFPAIVLDPFGGSGTTAGVALALGRHALMCEINPEYVTLMDARAQHIVARMTS